MAKNEKANSLPAKEEKKTQVVVLDENTVLNVEQLIAQLPKMEVGEKLTGSYWLPEAGESQRVFFVGKTTIRKKNADNLPESEQYTDAVRLLMEDGETRINGDKVVVSTLSRESIPSAFLIECRGWIEGKGAGRYRDFDINKLN